MPIQINQLAAAVCNELLIDLSVAIFDLLAELKMLALTARQFEEIRRPDAHSCQ